MSTHAVPFVLLLISNVFITFAWYGHLRYMDRALWLTVLVSWGIAFLGYCFLVPANRLGYQGGMTAGQLKVMQEAISLAMFMVFASWFLGEKLTWNYYAGFLMVLGGVAVMFWGRGT